ncbi:hypothetical protein H6G54_20290 [Anabaena cylindrica FACHB-243]|uniref:Uncharacterized protein n=1 Tax=Anabaena cylindrica (strain ATCC 27899 / PCC 7122) TaxID=272123 RepID=K9ZHI3_ANACC|nr:MULTISPECIES: hypothetical protein [Anabaena]AFZ58656.1 hypothetical protein Anacy_3248 [Anabaena cylindrica PCC 7122]MBD2420000.1 hypothetical protein [Anabaena cylindrica FACHB-243]MBY5283029.1 hypothetical protein [Anabaena sp. CCAP 1446/1C]MBY5306472.1 hypothetical protein [Anabaena sp. CCAP 1446/1C]MCM2407105.1 hypothetical protein [Anabaena sp. CCAP 1446/1C]
MFVIKFDFLPSTLLLAIAPFIGGINSVLAQPTIPICQPPNTGEYLLLVVSPTTNSQQQLRSALPSDLKPVTCKYLNGTVTRIGGFNKIDDANRWAKYVNNIVGLSAIITTRPTPPTVTPARIVPPAIVTSPPSANQRVSYNPKILGDGYAVLVDYFNRPEMASSLQRAVGGNVGLVSYGQRPYLLAVYTTNQTEAYKTLEKLNEGGFFALLADGKKVMLLRSVVNSK